MSFTILLVMPAPRRDRFVNFLSNNGLEVFSAENIAEASTALFQPFHFDVVLVDAELQDGSWQDLIPQMLFSGRHCEMVVCSRTGEEDFWAEVLQCGVFDLIPEPYEHPETLRIIRSAAGSQYTTQSRRQLATVPS